MLSLLNTFIKHTLFLIVLLNSLNSHTQDTKDDIVVVVQPIMLKNETSSLSIKFMGLTKQDSIHIEELPYFELNTSPSIMERNNNGKKYLDYYNYIYPKTTGTYELPKISAQYGDTLKVAKPTFITVVDSMHKINKDDYVLELLSPRDNYTMKDTIAIHLHEYSRFYDVSKHTLVKDSIMSLPKITGQNNTITIETDVERISGIKNLEAYIDTHFNVVDFDWDPFRKTSILTTHKGRSYIKTLLFTINVTPKNQGKFIINPSKFMFVRYNSTSDYYNTFQKKDNDTYTAKHNNSKIVVTSNPLEICIE